MAKVKAAALKGPIGLKTLCANDMAINWVPVYKPKGPEQTKLAFHLPLMVAANANEQKVIEGNLKFLASLGIIVGPDALNYK